MKRVSPLFAYVLLVSSINAFAVDDRGSTATQGTETWLRAAQYMVPKPKYVNGQLTLVPPVKVEVGQLMDPAAPQSPFAAPWSLTPNPTVFFGANGVTTDSRLAIFGHAGNGEIVCGDLGGQGTQMDALGHFGFINQPGDTPKYFGGLTQGEVVGPTGLRRLGIEKAEPIITSVVMLDAARYLNNGNALAPGCAITRADIRAFSLPRDWPIAGSRKATSYSSTPVTVRHGRAGHPRITRRDRACHEAAVFLAGKRSCWSICKSVHRCRCESTRRWPVPSASVLGEWQNPWLPFGVRSSPPDAGRCAPIKNLNLTEMAQKEIHLGAVFILPLRLKGGSEGASPAGRDRPCERLTHRNNAAASAPAALGADATTPTEAIP